MGRIKTYEGLIKSLKKKYKTRVFKGHSYDLIKITNSVELMHHNYAIFNKYVVKYEYYSKDVGLGLIKNEVLTGFISPQQVMTFIRKQINRG